MVNSQGPENWSRGRPGVLHSARARRGALCGPFLNAPPREIAHREVPRKPTPQSTQNARPRQETAVSSLFFVCGNKHTETHINQSETTGRERRARVHHHHHGGEPYGRLLTSRGENKNTWTEGDSLHRHTSSSREGPHFDSCSPPLSLSCIARETPSLISLDLRTPDSRRNRDPSARLQMLRCRRSAPVFDST